MDNKRNLDCLFSRHRKCILQCKINTKPLDPKIVMLDLIVFTYRMQFLCHTT